MDRRRRAGGGQIGQRPSVPACGDVTVTARRPCRVDRQRRRTHEPGIGPRAGCSIGLAAVAVVAAACSSAGSAAAPPARPRVGRAPSATYTIGISNPGAVGNGWREAMICSAKAQAVRPGNVTKRHASSIAKTDAAGQLADIRDLIAKGVNAISSTRPTRTALNPAIKEAIDAGIAVVAVDAPVTAPGAYNLSNDQEQYAYLGAKWLFEQLGGKGAVVYMRGIAGHPADTDRDKGFKKALAEYPGIKIAKETSTNWDQKTGTDQINEILSQRHEVRRRLDVRHRQRHRRGAPEGQPPACRSSAPTTPASSSSSSPIQGLKGAAVTNPPAVGGAGVVLGDAAPRRPEAGRRERPRHPGAVGQHHRRRQGQARPRRQIPGLPDIWPLGLTIKDWTTYTKVRRHGLQGPGRELTRPSIAISHGDAGSAGIPVPHFRSRQPPNEGLTEHDDRPAARRHRGRQALRRRRRPALRLARGPARRGPCAHGRQRRRQEHPRQDPDRRRPPRRAARSSSAASRIVARSPAEARRGGHRLGLPGAVARPGPRHRARTCA